MRLYALNDIFTNRRQLRLGEILVRGGIISAAQLDHALTIQKQSGDKLGAILLQQGLVSTHALWGRLGQQQTYRMAASAVGIVLALSAAPSFAATRLDNKLSNRPDYLQNIVLGGIPQAGLFGSHHEEYRGNTNNLHAWSAVHARLQAEMNSNDCTQYGEFCLPNAWNNFIADLRGLSDRDKIRRVHKFVNQYKFKTARAAYGNRIYWATPLEVFQNKVADCKAYALAKFALLQAAGIDPDIMRIAIVYNERGRFYHANLVIASDQDWLVLDNLQKKVVLANQISYYTPIYSVNFNRWWLHNTL